MSVISCYEPKCYRQIEVSCNCTSPKTYSCKKHLLKHCNSSKKLHNMISIFLDPIEGTKDALLNFLTEQKSKTDTIKAKIVTIFYQTLCSYHNSLKEILKEIDSDATKIIIYFDKIWKLPQLSKFEQDPVLNLLQFQPNEAIGKAKTIFTENKNIEIFNNMVGLVNQVIFNFNEEKPKAVHKQEFKVENIELSTNKELAEIQQILDGYKELIRRDPNNDDAYNEIGNIYYNKNQYEKALKYYENAIKINENQAIYYKNKGNALKVLERNQEAIESYKEAIRINPNEERAYNGIGSILYYEKKYEEALNYYNDAIRINPNQTLYYTNKGYALFNLGRKEEAIECHKRAIRINPNEYDAFNGLGDIYLYENKYEQALKYYNDAIRINPNNAIYYRNKGKALEGLGRIEEAEDCYREAFNIENTSKVSYL